MEEVTKHGQIGLAAMRAGMDRKTARGYLGSGKLPSESKAPHTWRTREDPFADVWPVVQAQLEAAPGLEAKTLFELLQREHPGRFVNGQLRTLQRQVRRWRAVHGPDKTVFFAQEHRPGEAAQTDFTHGTELGITIAGVHFVHLLCVLVLPYSNWQWVTVCLSESLAAIRRGVQSALLRLGRVPTWHQTDNSTAATHDLTNGLRAFNDDYWALMRHFGMKPRTIEIGEKNQNGDVEASNGAIKRRLEQALLLRGHRDFESREAYERWVQEQMEKSNAGRTHRLEQELAVMHALPITRLPEYVERDVHVSCWSTIYVAYGIYSVPSRLMGETVRARIFEDRIEIQYANMHQLTLERLRGRGKHRINYRHIIWSLVQKPGAFARYKYREELFPSLTFRRAYDALSAQWPGVRGDLCYLRVLHLAASTVEAEVERALTVLLDQGTLPTPDAMGVHLTPPPHPPVPELAAPEVDLHAYDALLGEVGT
jgi:hypothetical protein